MTMGASTANAAGRGGTTYGVVMSEGEEPVIRLAVTFVNLQIRSGRWWGRTSQVYRRHLFSFAASLPRAVAEAARKVTRRHVEAWVVNPNHSPAYQRVRLSVLRGLFRWATQEGKVPRDPTVGVSLTSPPEGVPRAFNDEDITHLFRVAGRDERDLAIVSLLWNEGLRRSEVAKALIEDWDRSRQRLAVRGKGYRGRVSRVVALSGFTTRALDSYLVSSPAQHGSLIRSRVFPTSGLSAQRVGEIVHDLLMDAGLKAYAGDGRSSHAGRHSRATQAVEAGVPSELSTRFFGWKSEAMLRRYSTGAALDLAKVHDMIDQRRNGN